MSVALETPRAKMIRIAIADDHPIVRRGLKEVFADSRDVEVSAEAEDAAEALKLVAKGACDVLVLDLSLPGTRGLELLRRLRREHPELPVVVLSLHPAEPYALHCLRAGAAAYLNKQRAPEDLVAAIRAAAEGRRYLSPETAERLLGRGGETDVPSHETLSEREYQVLMLIASGRTVGEIAVELGLSVKTVSTYRARMLTKMALRTNAEVTRYVFEHQLLR